MSSSMRAPSIPAIRLARSTSSSTGRSVEDEHQPVGRVLVEPQPAVARHRLGDVDEQRVRHRVAGVGAAACRRPARRRGRRRARSTAPAASAGRCGRARASARARRTARSPCGSRPPARGRPRAAASCRTGRSAGRRSSRDHRPRLRSGRSGSADGRALPRPVRRDVGPRRAPVGAVAPGLVGRGVDEHVGARARPRRPRGGSRPGRRPASPGRAATRRSAARPDRGGLRATCRCRSPGSWPAICGVIGCWSSSALRQPVTSADLAGAGRLEDRAQLALEPAQHQRVAVGALSCSQARALSRRADGVGVGQHGVDQVRRGVGVPDEVHPDTVRPSLSDPRRPAGPS